MALSITHTAVVATADDGTSEVGSNEWNAAHTLTGLVSEAQGGTGLSALGTGVATFLGTPSSANLASAVTDETGTGALVFASTPTLVTPVLGAATFTSLTGSGATVTASTPILDLSQTWNAGAVTFTALKLNITNTTSASGSLLVDLQVGGTSVVNVSKGGTVYATNQTITQAAFSNIANNTGMAFFGTNGIGFIQSGLLGGYFNGTPNQFTLAQAFMLGFENGASGSGDVFIGRVAAAILELNAGSAASVAYLRLNGVAVASLPAASATYKGARGTVTDSNAALTAGIGAVVANGGANIVPVFCDGTNWRIG